MMKSFIYDDDVNQNRVRCEILNGQKWNKSHSVSQCDIVYGIVHGSPGHSGGIQVWRTILGAQSITVRKLTTLYLWPLITDLKNGLHKEKQVFKTKLLRLTLKVGQEKFWKPSLIGPIFSWAY